MIYSVKSSILKHPCLLFCKKAYRTAYLCIIFLHFTNSVCKVFYLSICEADTAESYTMSCKMLFIHKVIVSIKLLIRHSFILFYSRVRLTWLRTICTILWTVAASYISEKLYAHFLSFILKAQRICSFYELIQLVIWQIKYF